MAGVYLVQRRPRPPGWFIAWLGLRRKNKRVKIVSVVGARPQFIKASALSRPLRRRATEILVHTGQHYDANMSQVFFDELGIPAPEYNLGVGSASHGAQTAAMLVALEDLLVAERPDWVLVYGDTNSTLAGALAAAKLHIPVAHVEAGLRSFNRLMPEEINRVVADHLSELLFCPSRLALENLAAEGIRQGVHVVGDVMAAALAYAVDRAEEESAILERLGLTPKNYLLVTVHRAENTDDPQRLQNILSVLAQIKEPVLLPLHPRTRKLIEELDFDASAAPNLRLIEPLGYLEMVRLEKSARLILTDSGGIQKEAYWLGVPCITLRDETEWLETVELGWNTLVGADPQRILNALTSFSPPAARPPLYQDPGGIQRIIDLLLEGT